MITLLLSLDGSSHFNSILENVDQPHHLILIMRQNFQSLMFSYEVLNPFTDGNAVLFQEGIESGAPGTDDGRFYFHLGDAMQRVGNKEVRLAGVVTLFQ